MSERRRPKRQEPPPHVVADILALIERYDDRRRGRKRLQPGDVEFRRKHDPHPLVIGDALDLVARREELRKAKIERPGQAISSLLLSDLEKELGLGRPGKSRRHPVVRLADKIERQRWHEGLADRPANVRKTVVQAEPKARRPDIRSPSQRVGIHERWREARSECIEMLGMPIGEARSQLSRLRRRLYKATTKFQTASGDGQARQNLAMGRSQFFYKRSRFFQLVEWDCRLNWLTGRLHEQGRCIRLRQLDEVKENRRLIAELNKRIWQCPKS